MQQLSHPHQQIQTQYIDGRRKKEIKTLLIAKLKTIKGKQYLELVISTLINKFKKSSLKRYTFLKDSKNNKDLQKHKNNKQS